MTTIRFKCYWICIFDSSLSKCVIQFRSRPSTIYEDFSNIVLDFFCLIHVKWIAESLFIKWWIQTNRKAVGHLSIGFQFNWWEIIYFPFFNFMFKNINKYVYGLRFCAHYYCTSLWCRKQYSDLSAMHRRSK